MTKIIKCRGGMNLDEVFWSGKFRVNAQKLCKQFVFLTNFSMEIFAPQILSEKSKTERERAFVANYTM